MSLSTARSTAQAIFNNTARQTAVLGTNISNTQNTDYNKRTVMIVSTESGARVGSVYREENAALFRQALESRSQASAQQTLTDGLTNQIANLLGGNEYALSPNNYLNSFYSALESYASKPSDSTFASATVSAAKDLANSLNSTSAGLQKIRQDADKKINEQVDDLNKLLAQFETKNNEVVQATGTGNDPNAAMDERDAILKKISDIVGVYTWSRDNGDMALYTMDGTTLFETVARTVSFNPKVTYDADVVGDPILVDGVPLTAGEGGDTTASGSLQALLQIRDDVTPTYQRQLDEIAASLVDMFQESNAGPPATTKTGLFIDSGDSSGGIGATPNMARRIAVNQGVVPPAGQPSLIRDGGINGPGFESNTTGENGYSALLDAYTAKFEVARTFSDATSIGGDQSILNFSTSSIGWFETIRSSATKADETKTALMSRTSEAYSNATGVSLDEELSLLLEVEQSYKAGTKLLNTIDEMIKTLLDTVG